MESGKTHLCPRSKLWISSDEAEGVFGDGKWRLLEAIEKDGSLNAASRSLGISYRKAWGDLKKAESCLDQFPLALICGKVRHLPLRSR